MSDIYDQHNAAFNRVSAFVVMRDGERVATIALKFPADGAGRLYAYTHWLGATMTRGYAGGYGYDKRSAAVESAVAKIPANPFTAVELQYADGRPWFIHFAAFKAALSDIGGEDWTRLLEKAGFTVLQAV